VLSVSYPADRRLQGLSWTLGRRLPVLFQYPILRIVGCKVSRQALGVGYLNLSVSYPADRRLQASCSCRRSRPSTAFQYPILRIVGCKPGKALHPLHPARLSVSYPADRRLQGWHATSDGFKIHPAFSILSCGSSVARRSRGRPRYCATTLSVSYPADRRLQGRGAPVGLPGYYSFSILSCGSSVARSSVQSCSPRAVRTFSILSCGSSVARYDWIHSPFLPTPFQYPILRIVGCKWSA